VKTLMSINPATGVAIKEFPIMDHKTVEDTIQKNQQIFLHWRTLQLSDRIKKIKTLSDLLNTHFSNYARLITTEMGKLYKEAQAEVKKCASLCEFYVQNAESFLADELVKTDYKKSYITYQPLGVILGIMPWNFPFWQAFRYAVPTLLAGNTVLLKHASNVPQCAQLLEHIFHEAGIEGFHHLMIPGAQMEQIIKHPKVQAISLTGSKEAGKQVASLAGSCIKKTVLELGGSDAYIILKDANLDLALEACIQGRMLNAGQSCISAKRFIVEKNIYDDFLNGVKQKLMQYQPGDPMNEITRLAPLATENIRTQLHEQVLESIKKGAQCVLGGNPYEQNGFYYQPTILVNIKPGMPAYDEELFGPVASVIQVNDEQEALKIANDHTYGLGGAIFSTDLEKAENLAKKTLQAGSCFVNDFVKSNPSLPFGGIHQSGYGRELSRQGIFEFTNIKTVCIKES
jgi:succinate-semialdehyde dehydrogenase / glutarate-semialdehyde dehydrogenase